MKEKQLDLFKEPVFKPEDIEKIDQAGQEPGLNHGDHLGHPRHKFRPPYPQGRDGNPVITGEPEEKEE